MTRRSTSCCRAWTRRPRCPACSPACRRLPRDRGRQRLRPTARRRWRPRTARRSCTSRDAATAPRCTPAWWRPTADLVVLRSTPTVRSTPASCPGWSRRSADGARPRRRPAGAGRSAGVWPWHARAGNAVLAALLRRRGLPVHDIAPIRAARRRAPARPRRHRPGLRLPAGAADPGRRGGLAGPRVRRRATASAPQGTKSKVSGSVRGTLRAVRDFGRVLRPMTRSVRPAGRGQGAGARARQDPALPAGDPAPGRRDRRGRAAGHPRRRLRHPGALPVVALTGDLAEAATAPS